MPCSDILNLVQCSVQNCILTFAGVMEDAFSLFYTGEFGFVCLPLELVHDHDHGTVGASSIHPPCTVPYGSQLYSSEY
jgi:hypothetical protein